jgi:hypothetical protein
MTRTQSAKKRRGKKKATIVVQKSKFCVEPVLVELDPTTQDFAIAANWKGNRKTWRRVKVYGFQTLKGDPVPTEPESVEIEAGDVSPQVFRINRRAPKVPGQNSAVKYFIEYAAAGSRAKFLLDPVILLKKR